MKKTQDHLMLLSLLTAGLLAGCSADDSTERGTTSQDAVRLEGTNDWQAVNGTRAATIYDDATPLTSFRTYAYVDDTDTEYISDALVEQGVDSSWGFVGGDYFWPKLNNLNFFAYAPSDLDKSLVSKGDISYSPASGPSFSVALPASSAGQEGKSEFIYAYETNKNKANDAVGVKLAFHHPFATLSFKLSKAHPGVTINSIKLKDVLTTGTFTHGSTPQWASLDGKQDFLATIGGEFGSGTFPQEIGGPYVVLPQNFAGGKQTIEVSYTDHGSEEVMVAEVNIPKWESGYQYAYTLTLDSYLTVTSLTIDINPWKKYEW